MANDFSESFSTIVNADVQTCFDTLLDFEAYPEWSSPITKASILERYPDGIGKRVEFFIDIKIKTIRYVLEYTCERPHLLEWTMADGDIRDIAGTYVLESQGKRTKATCSQTVSLGFWLPGFLRSTFEKQALKQSVLEFKAGAEKRARQAKT